MNNISKFPLAVLVVDDNHANIVSLETLLKRNGFLCESARSGSEALEKLLRNDYGLILLDVQMPDMDGFEVAEHLKSNKRTKYIPIIFISAYATDKAFFEKGMQLGAIDYVTKPFDPDILLLKVKNLMQISYTERELIRAKEELKILNETLVVKASKNRIAFENMFYNSPDLMLLLDKKGQIVDCNSETINFGNLHIDEFVGRHYYDLPFQLEFATLSDEGGSLFKALWQAEEDAFKDIELAVTSTEQGTLHYELNHIKTYDESGEELLLLLFKNVTQRKIAEIKLQHSENYYKTLIRDSFDVIAIVDSEGTYQFVSPGYQEFFGYSIEELIGKNAFNFVHPSDLKMLQNEFGFIKAGERIHSSPYRIRVSDGTYKWLQSIGTNLMDNPVINGFLINSNDITSIIHIQENLRASEERYRGFYESQTNYVIRTDMEGNYTYLNKKFVTEFGWIYPDGNILGVNSLSSIMEYDHPKVFEAVAKCMEEIGTVIKIEIDKPGQNGGVRTTLWDFLCITNSAGEPVEIQCVGLDITDKRKAEIELSKSQEQYKYLFHHNPASMFIWDFESKMIIDCNEACLLMYEYTREEFLTLSIFDIRPKEDVARLKKIVADLDAYCNYTELMHLMTWRHLTKKGKEILVEVKAHVLEYEGRTSSLLIINDITQKTLIQKQLLESNERYELINKATKDAIYDWDLAKDELLFSDSFHRIFGKNFRKPKNIAEWDALLHPDDADRTSLSLTQFLGNSTADKWIEEYRIVSSEGEVMHVEEIGYLTRQEDGTPLRMVGVMRNITLQKNLTILLEQTSELAQIGSWEQDRPGERSTPIYYSKTALEIIGESEEYFDATKDDLRFLDQSRELHKLAIQNLITKGKGFDIELKLQTPQGVEKWVRKIGKAEFIQGSCRRIFGSIQDITVLKVNELSLKDLNDRLKQYTKELEISNAELEQFAYIASHDLQEPLRMISSFMGQLEKKYKDQLDDKAKEYIHYAVDGAHRMRKIILDLLEYSRVGKHQEAPLAVDLNDVLAEVLVLQQKTIKDVQAVIESDELPVIHGHRAPMIQLFNNLIGNALKYQRDGHPPAIEISVRELLIEYEINISDNGIGIEKEYFDKIFIIFQRLHNSDEYSGSGMGLAIVKKIIDSLGGRISLKSIPGSGSTFTFTLPKR